MKALKSHIFLLAGAILLVFGTIVSITGLVGTYFGKTTEMIMLVIIAAILLIMLIQTNSPKGDRSDQVNDSPKGDRSDQVNDSSEGDRPLQTDKQAEDQPEDDGGSEA